MEGAHAVAFAGISLSRCHLYVSFLTRLDLVELLVRNGADIYKKNIDGENLLAVKTITYGRVDTEKENARLIQIGWKTLFFTLKNCMTYIWRVRACVRAV